MKIETEVLATELRKIASAFKSNNYREILEEAADRLEETEKIAEFYRKKAERRARKIGRRKVD